MGNDAKHAGIAKIRELVEEIEFAMLTTITREGELHSRPMATMKAEFDGDLWFFTQSDSHMVQEIEGNDHVNVSYSAPDDNTWVSLAGTARLVTDKAKMKELWRPDLEAYFPKGLDDPKIALIEVSVTGGEYWQAPGMIAYAIEVASAIVTGQKADPGEHQTVTVK